MHAEKFENGIIVANKQTNKQTNKSYRYVIFACDKIQSFINYESHSPAL